MTKDKHVQSNNPSHWQWSQKKGTPSTSSQSTWNLSLACQTVRKSGLQSIGRTSAGDSAAASTAASEKCGLNSTCKEVQDIINSCISVNNFSRSKWSSSSRQWTISTFCLENAPWTQRSSSNQNSNEALSGLCDQNCWLLACVSHTWAHRPLQNEGQHLHQSKQFSLKFINIHAPMSTTLMNPSVGILWPTIGTRMRNWVYNQDNKFLIYYSPSLWAQGWTNHDEIMIVFCLKMLLLPSLLGSCVCILWRPFLSFSHANHMPGTYTLLLLHWHLNRQRDLCSKNLGILQTTTLSRHLYAYKLTSLLFSHQAVHSPILMTPFIQPASQPVGCVQTKRHSRKNGKKKIEDCVKRCSCSRRRRRRHIGIKLGHDDEDTNLWRWFCSWWREETTWQVGWYSRETQSNQAVWPWWETPPTRGRKQATNEPNAISPHDLVVLLWCCAIAALLPWSLPLSHRKTLAPPFSLLSHTKFFFSLPTLSLSNNNSGSLIPSTCLHSCWDPWHQFFVVSVILRHRFHFAIAAAAAKDSSSFSSSSSSSPHLVLFFFTSLKHELKKTFVFGVLLVSFLGTETTTTTCRARQDSLYSNFRKDAKGFLLPSFARTGTIVFCLH